MSRKYAAVGDQTPASTTTIVGCTASTSTRGWLYELVIGSIGAPEDKYSSIAVGRYTAAGTSTSVTPLALDPANPAALLSAGSNHTSEPTYTAGATLLAFGMNARATFRWIAAPGGELVIPATSANGIGVYFVATNSTIDHKATIHWEE